MVYPEIKNHHKLKIGLFPALLIFGFLISTPYVSATAGCGAGSVWSEKAGLINFAATSSDCSNTTAANYGVIVSASTVTGYAWGAQTGWIHMAGTYSGGGTYGVLNDGTGKLSGLAWSEKAGLISFSGADLTYLNTSATNYGVSIDSSGNFQGYAWGAGTGWIHMAGTYSGGGTYGATTTWTANTAPSITAGPSDGSSATSPTNAGSSATFTTTATDAESDQYYLAICKTDSITAVNSAAPTCATDQTWCVSSSAVNSASPATCSYTTLTGSAESNDWYAFACDGNSDYALCSSANQGDSPFKVNHVPTFTAISTSPDLAGLGQSITFSSTASDSDTDTSADTVALYVCKSSDFTGTACGSAGEWCHSLASSSDPSCSYTVQSTDTTGTKTYYGYVIDNHNLQSASNPRSLTFATEIDLPVISGIDPAQGTVSQLPASITLTLNEIGYCRISTIDLPYSQMIDDCSGGGTTSITCTFPSTDDVSASLSISCQDALGNKNTASNNTDLIYYLPGRGGSLSFNPIIDTTQKVIQTVVEEIKNIPQQIAEIPQKVAEQARNIVNVLKPEPKEKQIAFPPIEETVTEEAPEALAHKLDIIKVKDFGELDISFLPLKFKDLVRKFPEVASTLEKVGITKADDVKKLNGVAFSFPGLSDKAGVATLGVKTKDFSSAEKENIPNNFVFARTTDNKIDLNMRVAFTDKEEIVQSFNIIQNRQINLVMKPQAPAKSVEGMVILLPESTPVASVLSGIEALAEIVLDRFVYTDDDKDDIYTVSIQAPGREGKYEIRTTVNYKNENTPAKQISIVAVVDPEGYIYEKVVGMQARIKDAIVSIYWLNLETEKYELWPAKDFQQENPRKTNETGKYSFLVSPGYYYLAVEAEGYLSYTGKPFQVSQGTEVNINIELVSKNWLARIFSVERILMAVIILLLISVLASVFYMIRRKKNIIKYN